MQMTLSYLREAVRETAGIANDPADLSTKDFFSDTLLDHWINLELSELHDDLVNAFEDYYVGQKQIAVSAGVESYALPADFLKCAMVYYIDSNGSRIPMRRFNLRTIDGMSGELLPHNTNMADAYRVMDNRIWFVPSFSGTAELWYTRQYRRLIQDDELIDMNIPVGWEDCVISGCAARCAAKEESDPNPFLQQKAAAKQRILSAMNNRDQGPSAIIDVYGRAI